MARDTGLDQAIKAAGGVGALARQLGIAQPSVSNWPRAPAERVLAIEAATGVPRNLLRPDLYPADDSALGIDDEVDRARAEEYDFLALLLGRAPLEEFLSRIARLRGDGSPLGLAHTALAEAAASAPAAAVEREYFDLFIGLGRGELLPYGSYYLAGFLYERPLVRVRADMQALSVERREGIAEPEDHIAILCETMSGIIGDRFTGEAGADRRFFERHIKPWAGRFFADLENASSARFYRQVGSLGRLFIEIETAAFAMGD